MGLNGNNNLHTNKNATPVVEIEGKTDLTKVAFISLVNVLLKVKVSEDLINLNAFTISDGKGGRILL